MPSPFRKDLATIKKKGSLTRDGETKPVMTLVLLSRYLRRPGEEILGGVTERPRVARATRRG